MFTWFRRVLGPTKRDLRKIIANLERLDEVRIKELGDALRQMRDLRKRFLEVNEHLARALKANSELRLKLAAAEQEAAEQKTVYDNAIASWSIDHEELLASRRKLDSTEKELAESEAGLNELIENNDRLVKLISDPKLLELELEPGGALRIGMEPCLGAKVLAASCADMLGNAENWRCIEIGPMPSDQGLIIVTVRRKHGKSPEVTVGELREELAGTKAELERYVHGLGKALATSEDLQKRLGISERNLSDKQHELQVAYANLKEKSERIAQLEAALQISGDVEKEECKEERERLEAQIETLQDTIGARDAKVSRLLTVLRDRAEDGASLRKSIEGWKAQSIANHKRAEDLEHEVARLTAETEKLKYQVPLGEH